MDMAVSDPLNMNNNFLGDPNSMLVYTSPSTKWIFNRHGILEGNTTLRCDHDPATLDVSLTANDSQNGSKIFDIQGSAVYSVGDRVVVSDATDITKYMVGKVTAWDGPNKRLTVDVYSRTGYFTCSNWKVIVALGIRVEGQRTNLLINSAFSGAVGGSGGTPPTGWSYPVSTGSSLVSDSAAAGGNKLTLSADSGRQFLTQSVSLAANTAYLFSVPIELVGASRNIRQFLEVAAMPAGSTSEWFIDGVSATGATLTAGKHMIGVLITTAATAGAVQYRLGVGNISAGTELSALTIDLPQIEAGVFRSSFIQTFGAQVTRAADNIDLLTAAIPFDQNRGTLVAEIAYAGFTGSPYQQTAISIGEAAGGSNANFYRTAFVRGDLATGAESGRPIAIAAGLTPRSFRRLATAYDLSGNLERSAVGGVMSAASTPLLNGASVHRYRISTWTGGFAP